MVHLKEVAFILNSFVMYSEGQFAVGQFVSKQDKVESTLSATRWRVSPSIPWKNTADVTNPSIRKNNFQNIVIGQENNAKDLV